MARDIIVDLSPRAEQLLANGSVRIRGARKEEAFICIPFPHLDRDFAAATPKVSLFPHRGPTGTHLSAVI